MSMHDWEHVAHSGDLILLQCEGCGEFALDSSSGCCEAARVEAADELRALADAMDAEAASFEVV